MTSLATSHQPRNLPRQEELIRTRVSKLGFSFAGDEVGNVLAGVDLLRCVSESSRRVNGAGPHMTSAKHAVVRHLSSRGTTVEPYALDVCSIFSVVRQLIGLCVRRAVIDPLP
jgi:hypothetical protein